MPCAHDLENPQQIVVIAFLQGMFERLLRELSQGARALQEMESIREKTNAEERARLMVVAPADPPKLCHIGVRRPRRAIPSVL